MKRSKRLPALLTGLALVLSLASCSAPAEQSAAPSQTPAPTAAQSAAPAPSAAPSGYLAGTYEGEGIGMCGSIWLSATFTADAVTDIQVTQHFETAGIGAAALPTYIQQVLDGQSPDAVDAVSGATATCEGFKTAIQACFDQANGIEVKKEVATEDETLETDVVVVGSGMAGMCAAVSAARSGANVVLLEKKSTVGTAGHSITASETTWQKEAGIQDSWEDLAQFWIDCGQGMVDEDMLRFAAQHSAESIQWLADNGVDFVGVTVPPTNPFQDPPRTHVTTANRNGQAAYILPLQQTALDLGVEIRLETRATQLIQDESGAVVGVIAENGERTVTVLAPSVVLATGGYGNNAELMRRYAPMVPCVGENTGASTGDGLIMALGVGAELVMPGGTLAYFANPDGAGSDNHGQSMYFNDKGQRFINENTYFMHRAAQIMEMDMSHYYMLYDSRTIDPASLETALANGSAFQADTLAGLAAQIGVNAAALEAQAAEYNGYCASGVDKQFGKPASRTGLVFDPNREHDYDIDTIEQTFPLLNPIEEGPFYAVRMEVDTTYVSGTHGGPKIDLDGHVYSVDGGVIPGLFATGEVANGQLLAITYPQSGASLSFCMTFGRYCGAQAAEEALAG